MRKTHTKPQNVYQVLSVHRDLFCRIFWPSRWAKEFSNHKPCLKEEYPAVECDINMTMYLQKESTIYIVDKLVKKSREIYLLLYLSGLLSSKTSNLASESPWKGCLWWTSRNRYVKYQPNHSLPEINPPLHRTMFSQDMHKHLGAHRKIHFAQHYVRATAMKRSREGLI